MLESDLVNLGEIKKAEFEKLIQAMSLADLVATANGGIIGITEKGKALLADDQISLFNWLYIAESICKRNLTTIIALLALMISVISLVLNQANAGLDNFTSPAHSIALNDADYFEKHYLSASIV